MRVLSCFSGIGGFDLGFERAGMKTVAHVEIDKYAAACFAKHFPDSRHHEDITKFDARGLSVDVVCGGFPCVGISTANVKHRTGLRNKQSSLAFEYLRVISECRPRWVVVENSDNWRPWVPTLRLALGDLGYWSVPLLLRACDFGAPCKRARAFVVAVSDINSQPVRSIYEKAQELRPVSADFGQWEQTARSLVGTHDGVSRRMALRALGNAVSVPVAEWIGRRIMEVGV